MGGIDIAKSLSFSFSLDLFVGLTLCEKEKKRKANDDLNFTHVERRKNAT